MEACDEEAFQDMTMALQRHVNLLRDPSKVKRRRAIQHISRKIEELCDEAEEKKGAALVVQKLFLEALAPNVTACLQVRPIAA
mmetsp:Transcript_18392/g.25847  ORF Transcript_18392/g.25847 Transcript_18392/m.25847 type:complete len:83 (-) Transcript_18392:60-308(-)|eukprot:CAMPEP_0185275704 /NCGR_PEP_ID=MMETSP1359-20130426/54555_1 /TAXON_ID=552665 /ORGANISM="Bigelowiella longifila, Strain CCMP242" /LENGTH=82 /DNA_ID=CAMNT_0027869143 /DNA_START=67 /DNA_END=315 /DNA_ORIENTATION=-